MAGDGGRLPRPALRHQTDQHDRIQPRPHLRRRLWRTGPDWSEADIRILTRDYGRVPTQELAKRLNRKKGGVYNKAWALGLEHGFMRAFTADEEQAIRLARDHGVSITDLSAALDRDPAVVSKHAIRMQIPFATRSVKAKRGGSCRVPGW